MEGNRNTPKRTRRTKTSAAAGGAPAKAPTRSQSERKPRAAPRSKAAAPVSPPERARMIQMAAYFRAERRGFAPGYEVEDWMAAEAEVEAQLAAAPKKTVRRARKPPSK